MSQHKLIAEAQAEGYLEQLVGPEKGQLFSLEGDVVSIGREEQNDIVLPSGSVSRVHAHIEEDGEGNYVIRDNKSKNGVQINGETVRSAPLHSGDVIQIGEFAFRFTQPREVQSTKGGALSEKGIFDLAKPKKYKGPPNRRPLIYGVVLVGLIAVLMMDQEGEEKATTKSKDEAPAADIAKPPYLENLDPKKAKDPESEVRGLEDPQKTKEENALEKLDWNNSGLRESEQYFRIGRREYLSKNYQRAIQFFRTSLSFNRSHPLSGYYLQLSVAEVEKEARTNFNAAIKYFESLQYERAIYHFSQSIALMAHRPSSDVITKAERYIKVSQDRLRAAELFP